MVQTKLGTWRTTRIHRTAIQYPIIQRVIPVRSSSRSHASFTNPSIPSPIVLSIPPHYNLKKDEVHCILGVNGSGKSRFLRQIQKKSAHHSVRIATLSLDAHQVFVTTHQDQLVANVLGGIGSPTARDLIVRLGLYPVWNASIQHLSTGEIRKVMLAQLLLQVPRPTVLLLDQPFDGLDLAARKQLQWLLGQLTRGFTKLLVDTGGRNEAFAYKTQVVMVVNRLEHVLPELLTHVVLIRNGANEINLHPVGKYNQDQLASHLQAFLDEERDQTKDFSDETLVHLVAQLYGSNDIFSPNVPAIELHNVSVAYGQRILLDNVTFKRNRSQHWALLGPNGSGKSSLMRVLMQSHGHGLCQGSVTVHGQVIAVVSTEQHVEMLSNPSLATRTVNEWIQLSQPNKSTQSIVFNLLGIPHHLLVYPFQDLSQGEQKLVQLACALVQCPDVLVLDEITHGLDVWNRQRVLRVINAIGQHAAHSVHLILITHHEDEIVECFQTIVQIDQQQLMLS